MAKTTEVLVKLKKTRKATSMLTSTEAQGRESRCALKLELPKELGRK
jgi:hypothetical protein